LAAAFAQIRPNWGGRPKSETVAVFPATPPCCCCKRMVPRKRLRREGSHRCAVPPGDVANTGAMSTMRSAKRKNTPIEVQTSNCCHVAREYAARTDRATHASGLVRRVLNDCCISVWRWGDGETLRRHRKTVRPNTCIEENNVLKATYLGRPWSPRDTPQLAVGLVGTAEAAVVAAKVCSSKHQQQLSQQHTRTGSHPMRERAPRKQRISGVRDLFATNHSSPYAFSARSKQPE
jgi:hypothetical protein